MLRACRRVLKPGGRIAYYNIFVDESIAPERRRRIGKVTPAGLYTPATQVGLLRSAGFVEVGQTDVTPEYERVQSAVYDANFRHERAMRKALGDAEFQQKQDGRKRTLEGIRAGALRRALFVARRR